LLAEEQKSDEAQKSFCEKDLDSTAHQQDDIEDALASSTALIEESQEESGALAGEVTNLKGEITALDKAVTDATKQRQDEHEDFITFSSENSAATQLIEKAKNRLMKFYQPEQYVEPEAPVEFVQLSTSDAPAPPPETWDSYTKKDGKSNGVMALMDGLLRQLTGELTEAKHDEETSQADYEGIMARSQKSRAQNVESITNKEAAKADLDLKVERTKEAKSSQDAELLNVKNYIIKLHSSCDFLQQNFDLRKAARSNEVDSLKNAKSVLSGADFQ